MSLKSDDHESSDNKNSDKTDSSKDKLRAAARKLFARKGYDAVSVKELADEAKLNVSLVSYHFGGKEGLYRACLAEFGQQRLAVAQRVLKPVASPEEFRVRLQMFIEEVFTCHIEQPEACQLVHREVELQVPVVPDIYRDTFLKIFETLVDFIKKAQNLGFLNPGKDCQTLARIFFSTVIHIARTDWLGEKYFGKTLKNQKYREQVIHSIVDVFLGGTLKGDTHESALDSRQSIDPGLTRRKA